ncbi:DUF1788 domain-containing protein [Jeotgalicoccus halotolerans]|uniref:Uncharacterized protein DUF1788 n=1 Tax=Jeotgalicoccus halotolerans TaxID=157227 RepID=A0A3E0B0V0_9STAP|nr:DUF1788 domain-containing protein [Jeotgalicoccus halotolerans]REG25600.1 uncharacterized protein DUF1788 [Jeotgalicoccus halotolerans]
MSIIDKRLDLIKDKIHEETFVNGKGLGNEISFYIFDYDPKDELKVRDHIYYLINDYFKAPHHKRKIIEFNLYEMFLDIAKEKNIYNQIFDMEQKQGKNFLYRALTTFARPEIFLDRIKNEIDDHNVIFITGVGQIYPFVRTHNILNNLQDILEDKMPVILFYPGQYSEQDLQLFNKLESENYYRAFRLIDNFEGEEF